MTFRVLLLPLALMACADEGFSLTGDAGGMTPDAAVPFERRACPDLFAQELLPTFELEIDPVEWAAMENERATWQERQAQGLDLKPYHPVRSFRYGDTVTSDVMVRLRGNPCCSWVDEKLQLQFSFNETNPDGRFLGLRKILLDAPRYNRSFLRERLALHLLRDMGLPAPCANNARLVVNGSYYGLYTHLEKVDREFLERNFADPRGNLFKKGHELKTNEDESPDLSRMETLWQTFTVPELEQMVDLDGAVLEWAGEAMVPNNDGYWSGGGNFYLYEQPSGKFSWVPWDFDSTFEILPADTDPFTWHKESSDARPHYDAVLADPRWYAAYVDALRTARSVYEPDLITARIDTWAAQIRDAAEQDPSRSFTFESHVTSVENLRAFVPLRAAFVSDWLAAQP
jgi:hypothetical protein